MAAGVQPGLASGPGALHCPERCASCGAQCGTRRPGAPATRTLPLNDSRLPCPCLAQGELKAAKSELVDAQKEVRRLMGPALFESI